MEKSRLSAAFPSLGLGLLTDPLGTLGGQGRRGDPCPECVCLGISPPYPRKIPKSVCQVSSGCRDTVTGWKVGADIRRDLSLVPNQLCELRSTLNLS